MKLLPPLLPLLALAALPACTASHGTGEACGPATCAADEYCCNESCGICASPGEGCIELFCADGGPPPPPPPPPCGDDSCAPGEVCCPSCPGEAGFCGRSPCPRPSCPPVGECDPSLCPSGAICCPGCPGDPPFCDPGPACPDLACPAPPECDDATACPAGTYCDHISGCGGPGVCAPLPTGCPEDCPGVCACGGVDRCNACIAASEGLDVLHDGSCSAVPGPCEGRTYCSCDADLGCEPLIDLTHGCVCTCDDPFNCSGLLCDCDCGGATYLGCAPTDHCLATEVECETGCEAALDADGCPTCQCPGSG